MNIVSRGGKTALAVLLVAAGSDASAQAARGAFEVTVPVEAPVLLDVRAGSGFVSVSRGAPGRVRVEGRIEARARRGRGAPDAEELVRRIEEEPPVEVFGREVRVGDLGDRDLWRYVSISYRIEVPADAEVIARTGSGSLEIAGVTGPVEARSGSGRIRISEVGGPVRTSAGSGSIRALDVAGAFDARTGSGSVTLTQTAAGDVHVTTGSGGVELRGVQGSARVRTGSGGVRIEGEATGPWDVATGSGSVRMRLPADASFELDAQTGSGTVQTSHPVTIEGMLRRNRVHGLVRGGGEPIRVRTGSGGIRIE